jgi:hypothetical protein
MITKTDLKENLQREIDLIPQEKRTTETLMAAASRHLKFMAEHVNELDPEATAVLDSTIAVMQDGAKEILNDYKAKEDTVENRQTIRTIKLGLGSHFDVKQLLSSLSSEVTSKDSVVAQSNEAFVFISQFALDLLSDIGESKLKAPDSLILSLFYAAIEELVIAHHLVQHAYAPQAFNHCRVVLEILDKVQLFTQQPQTMDIWTSEDEKLILKELSPSKVREKLGKSKYDETYGDLSRKGSHATFDYIRSKVKKQTNHTEKKIRFAINVGGSSDKIDKQHAALACVHVAGLVVFEIESTLEDH